jgi:undecaprenyl-diphosphatase
MMLAGPIHSSTTVLDAIMILELILDFAKLALIVFCLRWGIHGYVELRQPTWSAPLARRRLAVLLLLVLGLVAVKLIEDVLGEESGVVDTAILLFVHRHVPSQLTPFFEGVTYTGSFMFLLAFTVLSSIVLVLFRRRSDALIQSLSVLGAAVVIYLGKLAVNRDRPALWETEWYWGSSFPSGHTLAVAAFATAMALGVVRAWPSTRALAATMATIWICLVGLSRLVLGVHWPTDVLAAACIGASLPLALSIAIEVYRGESAPRLHPAGSASLNVHPSDRA